MTRLAALSAIAWAAVAALAGGCAVPADQYAKAVAERDDAAARAKVLMAANAALERQLADARQEAETLRDLGEKRLDSLFHVTGIKLGRFTAAADIDGDGADDGIRVYLLPFDQDDHTLKAAGVVRIRLFDLAAEEGERLVGDFEYTVEQARRHWAGGFATYHYKFDCPWKTPPSHGGITVRVEFTDYLTGKTFAAQKLCKLPAAAAPATVSPEPGS